MNGNRKKQCFVLMGFGIKVDYKTNRSLDLDKTYRIIRLAVEAAGLECTRADDIVHAGVIDKPMYENLLRADVAIADLSTSNENAIYELGVRHALKPRTTIVIAEKLFKFPFDLGHVIIRPYEHLGTGIDFEEAERLKNELVRTITLILQNQDVDSPIYTFLPSLRPPAMDDDRAAGVRRVEAGAPAVAANPATRFSETLDAFREAKKHGQWQSAKECVERLSESSPDDPYLVQQHALTTYKSAKPTVLDSLEAARTILQKLEPKTSGDPETLGLWGAIHKRFWEINSDRAALDEGIAAYERGFYLKRDYYTGINYAFMLNERARIQANADEAKCDFVLAQRIRRQLLAITEEQLATLPRNAEGAVQDAEERYWLQATRLEALMGLGDPEFEQEREHVFGTAPEPWMKDATQHQLDRLAALLR